MNERRKYLTVGAFAWLSALTLSNIFLFLSINVNREVLVAVLKNIATLQDIIGNNIALIARLYETVP